MGGATCYTCSHGLGSTYLAMAKEVGTSCLSWDLLSFSRAPSGANADAPRAPAGGCEANGAREPSVPVESWEPVFTNWAGLLRAAAYSVSQRRAMVVSTVRHEQGGPQEEGPITLGAALYRGREKSCREVRQ